MITIEKFLEVGGVLHIKHTHHTCEIVAMFDVPSVCRQYIGLYAYDDMTHNCISLTKAKEKAIFDMLEHRKRHLQAAKRSGSEYVDAFHAIL